MKDSYDNNPIIDQIMKDYHEACESGNVAAAGDILLSLIDVIAYYEVEKFKRNLLN